MTAALTPVMIYEVAAADDWVDMVPYAYTILLGHVPLGCTTYEVSPMTLVEVAQGRALFRSALRVDGALVAVVEIVQRVR